MEIIRNGVKITLTFEERDAAYREAKAEYMRGDVQTVIEGVCTAAGTEIPEKVKSRLTKKAFELYKSYEDKSDDWHYNCIKAVKDALFEYIAQIGKRKAKQLIDNC